MRSPFCSLELSSKLTILNLGNAIAKHPVGAHSGAPLPNTQLSDTALLQLQMQFDPQKHHRRSIRLKGYNYAQPGAYFVTICIYQQQCWFGEIRDGRMCLNQIGNIVAQEWVSSSQIRPGMKLAEWVIMPNHLHGIVVITDTVGAHSCAPLHVPISNPVFLHRQPRSLSSFVAQFKATVTKRINIIRQAPGIPIWQRNYHEKIVRDEESLHTIRQYIINNPQHWADDSENPQHHPENQQFLIDLPF